MKNEWTAAHDVIVSNRAFSLAEVSEIFSSLQGEGLCVGAKQVFVRFGKCNLRCVYCDESEKMDAEKIALYSAKNLLDEVQKIENGQGPHQSVALTGGEPLCYADFLKEFLPMLKAGGFKTYLETNGILPDELEKVVHGCDIVAMDIKLPSAVGGKDFYNVHEAFLRIAVQKRVFVKVVVTPDTMLEEIRCAVEVVRKVDPRLSFIFQPVTDAFGINVEALKRVEQSFFAAAVKYLSDVRVIPQMHKIWGVR